MFAMEKGHHFAPKTQDRHEKEEKPLIQEPEEATMLPSTDKESIWAVKVEIHVKKLSISSSQGVCFSSIGWNKVERCHNDYYFERNSNSYIWKIFSGNKFFVHDVL